ncbi:fatty acid--CoA ligase [Prauserella sp. PE36]|uniref:class I adenylate-forming enzyme family protein n=1 Tax=Prauserella sp. PE36 TaxID=1504709 RepID=UPI000DE4B63B|nr:AMP-binding protein [Prauserella sp. PE36]RBM18838.1 fatty acid--CoA ligase [Prauserella sp. PE36]
MATLDRAAAVAALTAPGAEFELATEMVGGRQQTVFAGSPRTLRELLLESARFGDSVYLVYGDERLTFAEHHRLAIRLAHVLRREYAIGKGDRIALAMRNYPEFSLFFWAASLLGAIVVPLNAWWKRDELLFALEDSEAVLLVADGERLESLGTSVRGIASLRRVISVRVDERRSGVDRFEDVRAWFRGEVEAPWAEVHPDDDVTILYTSGTTGRPKGAVGTHRNHCTYLRSVQLFGALVLAQNGRNPLLGQDAGSQPGSLATMPLFHISQLASMYSCVASGSKLVLMYKWDPACALDLIERERLTSVGGVPLQIDAIVRAATSGERELSSLTGIGFAATAAPPGRVLSVRRAFGGRVAAATGYGMTETSVIAMIAGPDYWAHPDSVGFPLPTVEVKVVDRHGNEVPPGTRGELWVRGPGVIAGYWKNPEATASAFTDGWHHTGDVVMLDDDGRLYVVDRLKDVVIRGGENVYCGEVEARIYEHEAVAAAAVIGLPHPTLGEEVAAVVQLRPGASLTEGELRDHVAEGLAAFKVPSIVVLTHAELPRTATGKVQKNLIREDLSVELGPPSGEKSL